MRVPPNSIPLVFLSASSALAAGTLEFSLESKQTSHFPSLAERDVEGTSEAALFTKFGSSLGQRFVVNLTVGTPPQPQSVLIDTGSSDTIFLASESFCTTKKTTSKCPGGTYNTSASSTFKTLSSGGIQAYYGEATNKSDATTQIEADLVTDVVQTGDIVVSGVHFGVAHNSTSNLLGNGEYTGLLGLSYPMAEAVKEGQPKYPTFVESLVGAGAIASRVFSLYLNEISSYGSILFGGLDTEKYTGNLTTLNLMQVTFKTGMQEVATYDLKVDGISATHEDGSQEALMEPDAAPLNITTDTGTPSWYLPSDLYNKVLNISGATNSSTVPLLPCSQISNQTSFTITISGNGTNKAQLEVPLASLFIPAVSSDGSKIVKLGKEELCILMVAPAGPIDRTCLFGAPVMRPGYWVFDMDNGQVSIAQTRFSTTSSNVVAIEAGPHGVMDAAKQPSALSANQTANVDGNATASVSPSFTTATSTVGQASGPQPTLLSSGAAGQMTGVTFGASLASALMLSVTFAAFLL
ncbi:hypothetical protein QM012_003618 [Aureobasidium pullulans]|uniref:Peptidase A1 domain-containing protein n=1 Tax=Aureobasidium pullulans TaxID=5580 RepID=A0ABR0T7S9_AURPU